MSSDAAAKEPTRNIRIGKYEVLSHIATGGMGAVYKARDTETGLDVALKVLSPELAAKPAMLERFRREAKHALKLRHKNIVTLYEFGEAQNIYFLVMELVDGIDLFEYLTRQGPLDPVEALKIIRQACRALDHAYQQGVVHRDIKPSNFLVSRQGERLLVKLTDFGLAREASNDEFRVTRAGTTIGTLDYMSPEQARDSGLADVRSDLYSLGCTWYHLLAGHAPFPKGGLGERLHRIMHEEPPDVREFNPRVSSAMASVVHRLLAKKPSQRYETPADLMRDLDALKHGQAVLTPRQALEILAQESDVPAEPPTKQYRRVSDGRRTPPPSPSDSDIVVRRRPSDSQIKPASGRVRSETRRKKSSAEVPTRSGKSTAELPVGDPESTPPYLLYFLGGSAAIILIVTLIVVLIMMSRGNREKPQTEQTLQPVSQSFQPDIPPEKSDLLPLLPTRPQRDAKTDKKASEKAETPIPPKKKPKWPALYRPAKPIDFAALQKETEAPWATADPSGTTIQLIVGRLPPDSSGKTFPSLAAACKAIPVGATGIIELRDNGPFFDIPASLTDRSLVLRAAKGFQPILVWDVQRMLEDQRRNRDRRTAGPADPFVFLDVKHGNLTLQDIHLAFKWPDAPSEKAAVLRVEDGDLIVHGCIFSVAGKPRDGVTLAQLLATRPQAGHCLFERCYARGAKLSVLDVETPGAQVQFENCLLIGDDAPLLQAHIANDRPTRFQVAHSTMICGTNLLELRPGSDADREPLFDWLGWDTLLSRKVLEFGGELLRLQGSISPQHFRWRAFNCLYAGWGNLVSGTTTIAATDLSAWQRLWDRTEGDEVVADPWPTAVFPEAAEVPANTYWTDGSLVAFSASTDADKPLGCQIDHLPRARDKWLSLTFNQYAVQLPAVPDFSTPPQIPVAGDGLFHGARLDLNQTDLGAYLQTVQKSYRLAPEVVMRLSGDGERLTTPLRMKGSNLVLYFEPVIELKEDEKKEPLVLAPGGFASAEALFDVEQGSLSIINGNLRFSEKGKARVVPWLIKIRGGDLHLVRTHVQVPPRDSGVAFRGLIEMDGSGDAAAERVRSCVVSECVLASARDVLSLRGIGARVLIAQSLLIAGEDVIHLTLDPDFNQKTVNSGGNDGGQAAGKANVQCLLDHATISARGAVVHLPEVKQPGPLEEPVVVRSHDCGFVNLFVGRTPRPGLVEYEGDALAQGLLIWQSENDAFDRRVWFGIVCKDKPLPEKPEDHASWMALWGSPGLRRAQLDLLVYRTLDGDRWSLDQRLAGWKAPGANLERLGLSRKPKSKTPRK